MKKLIKNVVSLDMTKATPESTKGVKVLNAVNILVTPATRPLVSQTDFGNIVGITEVPDNAAIAQSNGNLVIDKHFSSSQNVFHLINGKVIVKNNVTAETLQNIFACGARISGKIYLPDNLPSTWPHVNINGKVYTYPAGSTLFTTNIRINNGFLAGLPDGAKITIIANDITCVADDVDTELFSQKVSQLTVFGDAAIPAKLESAFYAAASQYNKVIVMPDGYAFYDQELTIVPSGILSLRGKKLYSQKNIIFGNGLEANQAEKIRQLDFALETAACVILPENLAGVLLDKVKAPEIYTYSGHLAIIDDEMTVADLSADEITSYLIHRQASLTLDEHLTNADIDQGIGEIFLYGELTAHKNQAKHITGKLVVKQGLIDFICPESELRTSASTPADDENSKYAQYDVVVDNAVEYVL